MSSVPAGDRATADGGRGQAPAAATVVLRPATRMAGTRRVVRRARMFADGHELVVRTHDAEHRLPVGPGGVVSVQHMQTISVWPLGRLHLCDAEGRSLACLRVNEWVPDNKAVLLDREVSAGRRVLERTGFAALFERLDLPVTQTVQLDEERPQAPQWLGVLRPGPDSPPKPYPRLPPMAALGAGHVVIVLDALVLFCSLLVGAPMLWLRILVWVMVSASLLMLGCGIATWVNTWLTVPREGRPPKVTTAVRPSSVERVHTGFKSKALLGAVGGELVLTSPGWGEVWLGGPSDPAGVAELVRVDQAGSPWGVALAGHHGTPLVVLPWSDWFSGDPDLTRLHDFAARVGIQVRERPQPLEEWPSQLGEWPSSKPVRLVTVPWESHRYERRLSVVDDDPAVGRIWTAGAGGGFPIVFFLMLGAPPLLLAGAPNIAIAGVDGLTAAFRWLRYNRRVSGRR